MLRKLPLKYVYKCSSSFVRDSALFINGSKATETFTYITPYVNFAEIIRQKESIHEQLSKRQKNINLEKVESLWAVYEELKSRKKEFDKKREEISKQLGELIKDKPKEQPDDQEVIKLKTHIGFLKDNLRKLKEPLWSAEEAAMVEALKLPNVLHKLTPEKDVKVLHIHMNLPTNNKDHLKIGQNLNLIELKRNENYYLKGDAAQFELGAEFHFNNLLRKQNFIQFSNPDFVKSVIVEGCGGDHKNPDGTFILHHNEDSKVSPDHRLHLTGGASIYSFFAYLAKNVVPAKAFPMKYFTMGRQYSPSPSEEDSLFHVSQASVVQVFGATKTQGNLDTLLDEMIEFLKESYHPFGYHFRICIQPAPKLEMWESLRLSLEMFSSSLASYVEVANVSLAGDFLSKRLMFTYVENKQSRYPFVMSGQILNVPKFLACALEQDPEFALPEPFKCENWFGTFTR